MREGEKQPSFNGIVNSRIRYVFTFASFKNPNFSLLADGKTGKLVPHAPFPAAKAFLRAEPKCTLDVDLCHSPRIYV